MPKISKLQKLLKVAMALSICWTYLSDVPTDNEKRKSCTNRLILRLRIDNRISFQNDFIFLMLIAQDTCSNENNISVYVQQIFQKLKLYQNRVD